MYKVLSTDFSTLTAANFEDFLASDDVFVHFINDFLRQPSFPQELLYNRLTGGFEVVSGAAELVSSRIRSALNHSKSQLLTHDPTLLARSPPVDNQYTVCCLDRKQGIQWIIEERLPFFLQSNCYYEYRLAKLLFQWSPNISAQRKTCSSGSDRMHQHMCQTSGQDRHISTKCSESSKCSFSSLSFDSFNSNLKFEKTEELRDSFVEMSLNVTEPSAGSTEEQKLKDFSCPNYESSELQLEFLAANVVKQVLKNAMVMATSRDLTNCTSTGRCCEYKVCQCSADSDREVLDGKKERVQDGNRASAKEEWDKTNWASESRDTDQDTLLDICCHGTCCNRPGLDEFKEFLRGTSGEKLLNLWVDTERLKDTKPIERKNRYLVLMRSRYLLSSSHNSLNRELLSRLGLATSPCWTEERLHTVQFYLTESLFSYWVPRFWMSQYFQADLDDSAHMELWREQYVSAPSDIQQHCGSMTLPQLCPYTSTTRFAPTQFLQLDSSRSQLLDSRRMESMLQALCTDSRAGLYFTHFCEQSGNQLWENAVYFWTDLQHYHELFYQDGLDLYRVQREAQLLYSTYLPSSARRSIGVNEQIRREVYDHLTLFFEELFDEAEEHTLNILLDPWTLLVGRDKESFKQVCVREEVRCVDTQEYMDLQSLYKESERKLKQQVEQYSFTLSPSITQSTSFSSGPRDTDSWAKVSPHYRGYRLGSLLRDHREFRLFMSFLQKQDACIHLTCWLDLEQYRRTPQKDKAVRQERSSHIANKYLNRKYFFGSDSPATAEQQNNILHLAGGLERLKLDCLSKPVITELQDIVRSHIEKTWLPLFLATTEFTERQKSKAKPHAAGRLSQHAYQRSKTRREAWKDKGLWMSSSKEILLFRRVLLDPATCTQFQHFVSLKGDYLENDLLFWLEVQRYKDLCHSHSDEATIQQKISTIINCFINSSMPPALQIDIPPEHAQHILDKRHELGPYIFREAQLSVFGELLKFWPEFQELRRSVQEQQLLPLLEEKRVKHQARVRRQRRKEEEEEEEEERRAQEELEMQESSCTEEEEITNDPTQPLSWSYSKYIAALKREEVLLRKENASLSAVSDSSFDCSGKTAGSAHSHRQPSRADGKQSHRYDGKRTPKM